MNIFLEWLYRLIFAAVLASGYFLFLETRDMLAELRLTAYNTQAAVRGISTTVGAIEAVIAREDDPELATEAIRREHDLDDKLGHIEARLDAVIPHLKHEQPQIIRPEPRPKKGKRAHQCKPSKK